MRHLFERVVRPLARPETPGAFYRGLRLMGIDGTVLDVPDSDANAVAFARPSAGERGDGAFPQVRKLSLVELGTHVEVALVVESISCGEHSMVEALLPHLTPEMLLLLDRGFFSYQQWQKAERARGESAGAGDQQFDLATDPEPGRRFVYREDLQELTTTGRRTATGSRSG